MNVLNFDSKQCERVRHQLDAYLSNELLVETTSEVLKHLDGCEACSQELESRLRVREALQRAVGTRLPPEYLREAIHQRLRSVQPRFLWGFRATAWALASLALVLVAGQQWLRVQRGRQLVASVLTLGVADHLHCAIQAHNYPEMASPPDQLRKKLGPEYAGLLAVVEEKLSGFQVLEAHICSVPGSPRKHVHFIGRGQGTILSVILTQRESASFPVGRFVVAGASGGVDLYKAQLKGFSVAGFESNEYFGFVVSDLGQNEVLQIATVLGPALRNALEGRMGERNLGLTRPEHALSLAVSRLAWEARAKSGWTVVGRMRLTFCQRRASPGGGVEREKCEDGNLQGTRSSSLDAAKAESGWGQTSRSFGAWRRRQSSLHLLRRALRLLAP